MMEERNEFEEYKMNLIAFQGDVICTSPGLNSPPEGGDRWNDPVNPGPEGPEGPDIFD